MTVLVAYATRHGATEGIATRVARRIGDTGTAVEFVRLTRSSHSMSTTPWVFGAPVYDQSWPPEADRFLDEHRDVLAETWTDHIAVALAGADPTRAA